jgi:hypothetical protein
MTLTLAVSRVRQTEFLALTGSIFDGVFLHALLCWRNLQLKTLIKVPTSARKASAYDRLIDMDLTRRCLDSKSEYNWAQAETFIDKIKDREDDGDFAYGDRAVPVGCYSILILRLRGERPGANPIFTETREQLHLAVRKSPQDAKLLSQLAAVDALMNNKDAAISEGHCAAEMLPISKDALDGPLMWINLAVVYAWTNESDLAFETQGRLTTTPCGIYYGQLRQEPYWEPLREDPRFGK